MNILVTGGAGFVGSVLCNQLLQKEEVSKVYCIDSLEKGDGDSLLPIINNKKFQFVHGDIRDINKLKPLVTRSDVIVHLAGYVGAPICSKKKEESESVNVYGTKGLVDLLSPNQYLINSSSGSVYGALEEICTEDSKTNPQSEYGIQKLEAEKYVHSRGNSLSYRFATGFGVSPNMRVNLLPNDLVYQAVHNKAFSLFQADARRTFIPVQEMARAIIHGINIHLKGIYNCGHERFNMTKRQLAEMIKEITNCTIFYGDYQSDPDQRDYTVNYDPLVETGFIVEGNMRDILIDLTNAVKLIRNTNTRYN